MCPSRNPKEAQGMGKRNLQSRQQTTMGSWLRGLWRMGSLDTWSCLYSPAGRGSGCSEANRAGGLPARGTSCITISCHRPEIQKAPGWKMTSQPPGLFSQFSRTCQCRDYPGDWLFIKLQCLGLWDSHSSVSLFFPKSQHDCFSCFSFMKEVLGL